MVNGPGLRQYILEFTRFAVRACYVGHGPSSAHCHVVYVQYVTVNHLSIAGTIR